MDQLERFNKLLSSTKGRDKVTKLLQSFSKLSSHYFQSLVDSTTDSQLKNEYIISVTKANSFDGGIASARKVTRFFNFINGYISLVKFLAQKNPTWEGYVGVLSQLCYSQYFTYDSLSWFAKLKILSNEKPNGGMSLSNYFNNSLAEDYAINSSKFWLFAIIFSWVLAVRKLMKAIQEKNEGEKFSATLTIITLSCDAICALSSSQIYPVSKRTFGTLAAISSAIGIYENW